MVFLGSTAFGWVKRQLAVRCHTASCGGCLLALFVAMSPAHAGILNIATQRLSPYASVNHTGRLTGLSADAVTCALRKLDLDYQVDVVPWARAEASLLRGTVDGLFPALPTSARDASGLASDSIGEETWAWYVLAGRELPLNDPAAMRGVAVGAYNGSDTLEYLRGLHYNVVAQPVNIEDLVRMLLGGRVQGILSQAEAVDEILHRDSETDQVRKIEVGTKPTVIYFSHKYVDSHPGFLRSFNQQIPPCRAELAEFRHTHDEDGYLKR